MGVLDAPVPFDFESLVQENYLYHTGSYFQSLHKYCLRHEVPIHKMPTHYLYGIGPADFAIGVVTRQEMENIAALAYWHHGAGVSAPLIIEKPAVTRIEALKSAIRIEHTLRSIRDYVPYTISWWYRPTADGFRDYAYFGLDHIGLEALVND
jgi:predicted transcriptional regulator